MRAADLILGEDYAYGSHNIYTAPQRVWVKQHLGHGRVVVTTRPAGKRGRPRKGELGAFEVDVRELSSTWATGWSLENPSNCSGRSVKKSARGRRGHAITS